MKINRAITRETLDRDPVWREPLMVRMAADGVFLETWQKGRRKKFRVRYSDIWRLGYMAEVRAADEARKAKRKAGKRR